LYKFLRIYFSEGIFYFPCLNSSKIQVCVFQQQKLVSIREKSKHTSEEKIGKQRNPNKRNKKQICTEGASENLMQQSPGKVKESRKILNDGKAVLLMVSWVRVDLDSFISLLRFS
jgi:hypothetical protein